MNEDALSSSHFANSESPAKPGGSGQRSTQKEKVKRSQTTAEEIANSVSHGVGALAILVGAPFLVLAALKHGSPLPVIASCVFAASAFLLYLASCVYHALPNGKAKEICEVVDHAAIYLLIAGSYTPFTLGILQGTLGWTLFGLVWSMAILGVIMKTVRGVRNPFISVALYLLMGWLIVIAGKTLIERMPTPGLIWLAAGGVIYSLGVIFYLNRNLRFGHLIWHLFVLGGTTCHFFAVLWYSM
jgi:hemolysin III